MKLPFPPRGPEFVPHTDDLLYDAFAAVTARPLVRLWSPMRILSDPAEPISPTVYPTTPEDRVMMPGDISWLDGDG